MDDPASYPEYVLAIHSSKRLLVEQISPPAYVLADAIISLTLAKGQRHEVCGKSASDSTYIFSFNRRMRQLCPMKCIYIFCLNGESCPVVGISFGQCSGHSRNVGFKGPVLRLIFSAKQWAWTVVCSWKIQVFRDVTLYHWVSSW